LRKAALIILILVLLVAGAFMFLKRRHPTGANRRAAASRLQEPELSPAPEVALQVDRESDLVVTKGTPLILSVTLANPRAMNAALENEANQALVSEIEAGITAGKIARETEEPRLARLRQPVPVQSVRLGDETTSWKDYVHFSLLRPDGHKELLPWSLRLAADPESSSLSLGNTETAQLDYLLDPAAAAQIPPGDYQILVSLQAPANKPHADTWEGETQSEPVRLSIVQDGAPPTAADQEKTHLQFAYYYQPARDWTHALESAQKARAVNQHSLSASLLIGEVREAQGDLQDALEAYQASQAEFRAQYPKSYEPPLYIIDRISSLRQELEGGPK